MKSLNLSLNSSAILSNVRLTDSRALVYCLSIGFFVNLILESLDFITSIRFEIIHYMASIQDNLRYMLSKEHCSQTKTSEELTF